MFRGAPARIKPPRVFAVIPLLSRMPNSPRGQTAGDVTPFLVVLDEIWFREYGIGERLAARLATVKPEIGDSLKPTALRYGPLPDHNLDAGIALALPAADAQLDCFGPFGFTLDRGDDQALANATGFIVYPPPGTPAHYNLFVEFERWFDLPSGALDQAGARQCRTARRPRRCRCTRCPTVPSCGPTPAVRTRCRCRWHRRLKGSSVTTRPG